jgi:ribosomal protein S1
MADKYVKSPYELVGVGDVVNIRVLSVDVERGRIGLSMKQKKTEPIKNTTDSGSKPGESE